MLLWCAKCILISLCLLSNSYMSQASSFRTFFLHKFPTSANNITAILKYDYHLISATSQTCTQDKQSPQLKEKLTAFVFRVEFLLKIYDTELAFMVFSFRHNDFTSLFVAMPILLYHTICLFVWTFAC